MKASFYQQSLVAVSLFLAPLQPLAFGKAVDLEMLESTWQKSEVQSPHATLELVELDSFPEVYDLVHSQVESRFQFLTHLSIEHDKKKLPELILGTIFKTSSTELPLICRDYSYDPIRPKSNESGAPIETTIAELQLKNDRKTCKQKLRRALTGILNADLANYVAYAGDKQNNQHFLLVLARSLVEPGTYAKFQFVW